MVIKKCKHCGKIFEGEIKTKFCSNACKSAWRREQGIDNETRICICCSKEFITNKYTKVKTCSKSCSSKIAYQNRK
jgi:hypothetical protein